MEGIPIFAFGEALWDLLPSGPVLGGAPLNFAFRMNKMGKPSALISSLGRDEWGMGARKALLSLGLSDQFVYTDNIHPTGTVDIQIDAENQPIYTIKQDVAYDYIPLEGPLVSAIQNAELFCFGTLAQRNNESRKTLKELLGLFKGKYLLCDINLRKDCYSREVIESSLEACNVVKLNDEELMTLRELFSLTSRDLRELAQWIKKQYRIDILICTMGRKGAFLLDETGVHAEPGFLGEQGDPCGAGDAFTAALMTVLMDGGGVDRGLLYANATGGLVAGQTGTTVPVSIKDVEIFMNQTPRSDLDEEDFILQQRQ